MKIPEEMDTAETEEEEAVDIVPDEDTDEAAEDEEDASLDTTAMDTSNEPSEEAASSAGPSHLNGEMEPEKLAVAPMQDHGVQNEADGKAPTTANDDGDAKPTGRPKFFSRNDEKLLYEMLRCISVLRQPFCKESFLEAAKRLAEKRGRKCEGNFQLFNKHETHALID